MKALAGGNASGNKGALAGNAELATVKIENCYFLDGSAQKGVGTELEVATVLSAEEMVSPTFIKVLNGGRNVFTDDTLMRLNRGLPWLAYELGLDVLA